MDTIETELHQIPKDNFIKMINCTQIKAHDKEQSGKDSNFELKSSFVHKIVSLVQSLLFIITRSFITLQSRFLLNV